jgi:TatD DNase family protein
VQLPAESRLTPSRSIELIDTHCHLDMASFHDDLVGVLARATAAHITSIVTIGIDPDSSRRAIALAQNYSHIFATIGIHPHDVQQSGANEYRLLENLYADYHDNIVGYGEIGLDYVKGYSDPALQRSHFKRQLDLAHDLKLPVIIHNRQADDDTLALLRQAKPLVHGGIMHCFSGDLAFAEKILDLGLLISIPGIVTFKNALTLQEVALRIPLSSMVLETDGPFLAPAPYRGRRNEPAYLQYIARKVAMLRDLDLHTVAAVTTKNARRLFKLTERPG